MLGQKFNTLLSNWYLENARKLPWTGEKNPYHIWLREIILQQTRVDQGILYYHKFIKKFPTIKNLARAHEDVILKMWEGLGYNSRARNLHTTAKTITDKYDGKFPNTYEEIIQLKGVGNYTAAAIASFAYELPYAVVDVNVVRILSRIFGINETYNSSEGKKTFNELANKLLDKKSPSIYNQAMMDFGATVCKPINPLCDRCPFNKECYAFKKDVVNSFPVKLEKTEKRKRFFHYLIIQQKGSVIIEQRKQKDIWNHLYQFPLIECKRMYSFQSISKTEFFKKYFSGRHLALVRESEVFTQQLTHQTIKMKFFVIAATKPLRNLASGWKVTEKSKIKRLAMPGIIRDNLKEML